jgi:hypothetical protein
LPYSWASTSFAWATQDVAVAVALLAVLVPAVPTEPQLPVARTQLAPPEQAAQAVPEQVALVQVDPAAVVAASTAPPQAP